MNENQTGAMGYRNMTTYLNIYKPTELFSKKLNQIKTKDTVGYQRIKKVINRLLIEPNQADGKMTGLYNGRFKKYVGRRDYRIIYYWCQLCRKENRRLDQNCDDCQTIPDNSVIFFHLYHKKDQKKFKRA